MPSQLYCAFSDIFKEAQPLEIHNSCVVKAPWGPWRKDDEGKMEIGTYCKVFNGRALHVKPSEDALNWVRENLIDVEGDSVFWEITANGNLYAKYNTIIGSRVVCRIDPATIPFQS